MTKSEQLNVITHNILFANDLACGAVVQAVADARKSPLCRYRFRQRINAIEKERRDYEPRIRYVVESKADYYMEACGSSRKHTVMSNRGDQVYKLVLRLYDAVPEGTTLLDMVEASELLMAHSIEQTDPRLWDVICRSVAKDLPKKVKAFHRTRDKQLLN